MTKDDILQALRLLAMGRTGHPLQEQLAEKLAEVFAPAPSSSPGEIDAAINAMSTFMSELRTPKDTLSTVAKIIENAGFSVDEAAPKRRKKAD